MNWARAMPGKPHGITRGTKEVKPALKARVVHAACLHFLARPILGHPTGLVISTDGISTSVLLPFMENKPS